MSNEQKSVREEKLNQIRDEFGVDPYPARCSESLTISEIRETGETEGSIVASGRLAGKREHGKTIFADMRDRTGSIQLYCGKKVLSEKDWSILGLLDLGDISQVPVSVSIITRRSIPTPIPPVGGIPVSSAKRKSSSTSPCLSKLASACCFNISLCRIGLFCSLKALASSSPAMNTSNLSVSCGLPVILLARGESSAG